MDELQNHKVSKYEYSTTNVIVIMITVLRLSAIKEKKVKERYGYTTGKRRYFGTG